MDTWHRIGRHTVARVTAEEAAAIERRVGEFEARTGVEIVAAVEQRCDLYPEAPWRAFALGASLASLGALAGDLLQPAWTTPGALLVQAATILGLGAVAALAAMLVPSVGRLFIGVARMREEVRQRAEAVFLQRELFATPGRDAILLLVSRFEHAVVVRPDVAYRDRVTTADWRAVVERMKPPLARDRLVEAFDAGCATIEALLAAQAIAGASARGVLSDAVVHGTQHGTEGA
jgi:putative membrane protein